MVELAGESSVRYVKLKHCVARWQCHVVNIGRIPRRDDVAARIGIVFQGVYDVGYLVNLLAVGCAPMTPLIAVDGAEVAVGVCPFVPNAHSVVLEVLDVGVAVQKPQEFVDDGF